MFVMQTELGNTERELGTVDSLCFHLGTKVIPPPLSNMSWLFYLPY